ncbi:prepilin peptidase [Dickeya fangzhongdai]|uniref:Prepilin peptidase n=1 Tax=Dickeya fangzhongdai TaxID=1778540 RepID=A0A2K8QHS5_9GAMM|nr:A24 family peptidase [Dickeya fangzhongdai]ATZ93021.1 prepilin peptidase [Dickeya fangzhongdai]QOH46452.1 prepilin peptidase [Dickeya fangzhongdai]QOH50759.1 prepilin peptidase [Dickeya fangzhongdai]WOY02062.1 A24 family peptidase [Dickeya fangzhongdai]GGB97558.1 peptidase [Dickeya fangzhongdai]
MTLLTLSMPWPTLIIIFPLGLCLFNFMASLVRLRLMTSDDEGEWFAVFFNPVPSGFTWLYAAVATGMILSPAPVTERLLSLLFSLFLFNMTLTDALTGLLPREMTVSCLIAGLTAALLHPGFTGHILSAVAALGIFGGWRYVTTKIHGRECLGLGDVWLAGAIAAWLGGHHWLYALLTGVVLFVLWQISVSRSSEGGPMGPWLCAGAMSVTLLKLYQPLITW